MVRLTANVLAQAPQYWRRYIDRCVNLRSKPARKVYLRGWVGEDKHKHWLYSREPPYTEQNQMLNNLNRDKHILERELLYPIKQWTVMLGDRVEILVGRDKGKQGIINRVVPERNWVFVEGLNLVLANCPQAFGWIFTNIHFVLNKQYVNSPVQGGPVQAEEMPLNVIEEVALVDPTTEKASVRCEWRYTEQGEKVRVVYPSEAILPLPSASRTLADGVDPVTYLENLQKDTLEKDLEEPTYKPKLTTFTQNIMDSMGISESRARGRTYWY